MADKEKSKLEQLQDHFDERLEAKVSERVAEASDNLKQQLMPAVHTESRTSKWADYKPSSEGKAFQKYVETGLRAIQSEGNLRNMENYADKTFVKRFIEPMKRGAPIASNADGGDQILEQPLYQEVSALLRKRMVLGELGITQIPLTSKTLDLPREIEKGSFAYTNEGSSITESQHDFDQKQLVAKKLAGRVGMTNDWLRMNPVVAAEWIAARMLEDFAVTLEKAVIDGLSGGPEALFDGIDAGNKFELTAGSNSTSSDFGEYDQKLDEAIEACVVGANVREEDVRILMNTKHKNLLRRQFQNSAYRYRGLREDGTLADYPVVVSNHIASDYDDSGQGDEDETRVFVGDFSNYWLGILTSMELEFSDHSRFATDEVEYRLVGHHDGLVKRGDRLAVLSTDIDE